MLVSTNMGKGKYIRTQAHIDAITASRKKNPKFMQHLLNMNHARKGTTLSEDHKTKIGLAGLGRKHSTETKNKIGNAHRGKKVSIQSRLKMSLAKKGKPMIHATGVRNYQWKGKKVSYRVLHSWVQKWLGKPTKCCNCGVTDKIIHWANISHKYKRDLNDFMPLCVYCHKNYDLKKIKILPNGMQFP